jgi:hypothetical protein
MAGWSSVGFSVMVRAPWLSHAIDSVSADVVLPSSLKRCV